jgi:SdpI/YfhL protein family
MRLIPVAELFAGLVIGLAVFGLRALWGFTRPPFGRGAERAGERREPGMIVERKRAQLMASCIGLAVLSIPLILRMVPPNGVYGFRVAATQSSPAIWYSANAFMGWALFVAAVISAGVLAVLPVTANRWLLMATFLAPMFAAIAASFAYLNRII